MDSVWVALTILAPYVTGLVALWIIQDRRDKSRKTLTPRELSEVYRDMEWWDREFAKLNGEPVAEDKAGTHYNLALMSDLSEWPKAWRGKTNE